MEKPERFLGGAPANAIHLVRTTQQAQYQLSQMADQKASMLMAATFVIFTITIGQAKNGGWPPAPLVILGVFAFLSAVFAVLTVIPVTGMPRDGCTNILFFGHFAAMEQPDYVDHLLDTLESDETIYRTMAIDIYQNGRVLAHKKYRMLRYAYRLFLLGLTLSLATFVAERIV